MKIFEGVNNSLPIRCDCLELLYSQIMVLYRRAISLEETSAELEKGTERLMQFDTLNDLRDYLKRIASGICRIEECLLMRNQNRHKAAMRSWKR